MLRRFLLSGLAAAFGIALSDVRADLPARIERLEPVMYKEPEVVAIRAGVEFSEKLKPAWLEALKQPDVETKLRAAQTIAVAFREGLKGLESTVPDLLREFQARDAHPMVLLAVAETLIALDARSTAHELFERSKSGEISLRELVEPALARWKHDPARAVWLERLAGPGPLRGRILAAECLAVIGEAKAVPTLREFTFDPTQPSALRVVAARALGRLRPAGAEADARKLMTAPVPSVVTSRFLSAMMLRQHSTPEAILLLQELARDKEPATASAALSRLVELDPKVMETLLEGTLAFPDAQVRSLAVQALLQAPNETNLKRLGDRLSDAHRDVRIDARRALETLAKMAEWKPIVIREGTRVLDGTDWRGLQQATLLLGHLGHKPASPRLLQLLPHARSEVFVTAAWGLQTLAVPEMLDPVFAFFQQRLELARKSPKLPFLEMQAYDEQLCFLAIMFGQARYQPADKVLQGMIPPQPVTLIEGRSAAIWALGYLYEDKVTAPFTGALVGRMNATAPPDVEAFLVRQMSALTLGRIRAKGNLDTLRKYCPEMELTNDTLNNSCGWGIERITGEKMKPASLVLTIKRINYFLIPVERPSDR